MTPTVNLTAAQNPSHPHFHISLGQIIGLALLGLQAFQIQDQAGTPSALLQPQAISGLTQGILSILTPPPATGQ